MTASIQTIDVGKRGNDGTGDTIREAFKKVNSNFSTLANAAGLNNGALNFADLGDFGVDTYLPNQVLMSTNSGNSVVPRNIVAGAGVIIETSSDSDITISSNVAGSIYTDQVIERNGIVYFTESRARDSFSAGSGISIASGVISVDSSIATTTDLDTEITRALNAEYTLQSNINIEITRATNVESSLQSNIDTEYSRAVSAEITLQANIDAEVSRALSSETTINSNITTEFNDRTNADITLQTNIDAEYTRAFNVESTLQANIDAEYTRATAAESTLQANINTNSTDISNIETTLSSAVDVDGNLHGNLYLTVDVTDSDSSPVSYTSSTLPGVVSDDCNLGSKDFIFPAASSNVGRTVIVINRNSSGNTMSIYSPTISTLIDTVPQLTTNTFVSDGITWYKI